MGRILDLINSPKDIRDMGIAELDMLSEELRQEIISTISKVGGHLASSLGVVELSVALHYAFDTPQDKIIWDVGHQCYAHKLLTGRKEAFASIRQHSGISGFPKRMESEYDVFGTGHSSTSISAALGIATARDLKKEKYNVVAVIGDGAITGGLAYEGLNNAGSMSTNMIVVLNDNEMSISKNVGAMAAYFNKLRMNRHFQTVRREMRSFVRWIPKYGTKMLKTAENLEDHITYFIVPGVLFEALGFTYLGPFDGHDIEELIKTFDRVKAMEGPIVVHLVTQKGRGYLPAEKDATRFHSAAPFEIDTGECSDGRKVPTYTEIFGDTLSDLSRKNEKIVAITAAMVDGTGLLQYSKEFPGRFFDVGIAEQHAVTFAAGLATSGLCPVVTLYSTFLQRAFDQIIHDVCLQNLHVVFAIDRAGIVGEDGPTHQGVFDISFLRMVPNLVVMTPKDENEFRHMLATAVSHSGPVALRYPRGRAVGIEIDRELKILDMGKAEVLREGKDIAIIAIGNLVYPAILAAEKLEGFGISATVINARFIKPLDEELILKMAKKIRRIITVEENVTAGGFGSAVQELLNGRGFDNIGITALGLPDCFIEHGAQSLLREKLGMTTEGITQAVVRSLQVPV